MVFRHGGKDRANKWLRTCSSQHACKEAARGPGAAAAEFVAAPTDCRSRAILSTDGLKLVISQAFVENEWPRSKM